MWFVIVIFLVERSRSRASVDTTLARESPLYQMLLLSNHCGFSVIFFMS